MAFQKRDPKTIRKKLGMKDSDSEALKITWRKGARKPSKKEWTDILLRLSEIQVAAMAAGQKTARKHFIAIQKELEYHVGYRFERIDPETHEDDPRRG